MKKGKKVAAFFDFDGTIYNGVVAFDFLKFIFNKRILKFTEMLSISKLLYYYILDKFNLAERYSINERIYQRIQGWDTVKLENASKKFFVRNIKKKLYLHIVKIIDWHAKKNHRVVIVTSALKEIVEPAKE